MYALNLVLKQKLVITCFWSTKSEFEKYLKDRLFQGKNKTKNKIIFLQHEN